jgi:hypothetical protein
MFGCLDCLVLDWRSIPFLLIRRRHVICCSCASTNQRCNDMSNETCEQVEIREQRTAIVSVTPSRLWLSLDRCLVHLVAATLSIQEERRLCEVNRRTRDDLLHGNPQRTRVRAVMFSEERENRPERNLGRADYLLSSSFFFYFLIMDV